MQGERTFRTAVQAARLQELLSIIVLVGVEALRSLEISKYSDAWYVDRPAKHLCNDLDWGPAVCKYTAN